MDAIKKWFETKDYNQGLALLAQYSKNRVLLQNISRKPFPAKLEFELRRIAQRMNVKPAPGTSGFPARQAGGRSADEKAGSLNTAPPKNLPKTDKPKTDKAKIVKTETGKPKIVRNSHDVNFDDLPPRLQKLWEKNRDAYKEIRALHEKLKLMEKATPEDREPITSLIAQLDDSIRENWKVIDAWDPDAEPEQPEPAKVDHKRINSNRKYISTNLKRLGKLDGKKATDLREKIQVRVDELVEAGENISEKKVEELQKLGVKL